MSEPVDQPQRTAAASPTPARRSRGGAVRLAFLLWLGALLTILATWWPLESGAFFPTVHLPGAVLLYAALLGLLVALPGTLRLGRWHTVALGGLLALVGWIALSIAWSPAGDVALEDALRAAIYPAAFLVGLALARLLGADRELAAAPWVAGVGAVLVVTCIRVLGAEGAEGVLDEGTLELPFGYRNANATFFLLGTILMLWLVAHAAPRLPHRAFGGAAAAGCLAVAVLCQSRGSVLAALAGVAALVMLSPHKLRTLAALGAVALPVAALVPELLDPFSVASEDSAAPGAALRELQDAVGLIPLAAIGAGLLTPLGLALADRTSAGLSRRLEHPRRLAWAAVPLALAGAVAIAVLADPLDRLEGAGEEGSEETEARFTYTGGLNRTDFYSVAAGQFTDAPVLGGGSGSFRTRYALERATDELPRDPHSLPIETASELGLVGLGISAVAVAGLVGGAWRARHRHRGSPALAALALSLAAAWGAQASIDWLTSFPALTTPVLALLGAAAAPLTSAGRLPGPGPRAIGAGVLVVAIAASAIAYVAERDLRLAAREWRSDPSLAFARLERAQELNPLADAPLQVEAQIAREIGDVPRALAALETAREREPAEWRTYVIAASVLGGSDPERARAALDRAAELNPLAMEVRRARRALNRRAEQ